MIGLAARQPVELRQRGIGIACLGKGDRTRHRRARRWRKVDEQVVESHQRHAQIATHLPALRIQRLDSGLGLEAAGHPVKHGGTQQAFGLQDHRPRPELQVLIGKRDERAVLASPRRTPRLAMEYQCEQPHRLGIVGKQFGDKPPEPDRLFRQPLALGIGPQDILPVSVILGASWDLPSSAAVSR